MATRIVSELIPEVNYDFLFEEDNHLDKQDVNVETDLHEINIFGNMYHIAMGEMKIHPQKKELCYFIAYLIYDSNVICKLGIYEKNNLNETITHRTMEFQKYKLLLDQQFYKDPDGLTIFKIQTVETSSSEKEKEEKEEKEEEEGEEGEIQEEAASEEEVPPEEEEQQSLFQWINKETKKLRKIPASGPYNILEEMTKESKIFDENLDYEYKKLFNKNGDKVKFNPSFLKKDEQSITKSILIAFEYILQVKFICYTEKDEIESFSVLDNLSDGALRTYKENNKERSLFLYNNPSFKKYNPKRIILLKHHNDEYQFVQEVDLENDKSIMTKIKRVFETTPHEHFRDLIKPTPIKSIKLDFLKKEFKKLS